VRSTVGAGDSTVAGYLVALAQGADAQAALRLAMAAGSATAFSDGLATREDVEKLLEKGE
jgi:1-phosphofructokinase